MRLVELRQIALARRKDEGGLACVFACECLLVRLHRTVEGIELRVLAKALGIDSRGRSISLGADDLRLLLPFGDYLACLLIACGAHAGKDGIAR